jgi:transposase InsO family protein
MKGLLTQHDYPVGAVCKVLQVSRSGYYAWLERPVSDRARTDERLSVAVRAAHEAGRHTYGTRRVHAHLVNNGVAVGRDRVGRLRRQLGLRCKQKRCFRVTTDSAHTLPVADNRERPVTPY